MKDLGFDSHMKSHTPDNLTFFENFLNFVKKSEKLNHSKVMGSIPAWNLIFLKFIF